MGWSTPLGHEVEEGGVGSEESGEKAKKEKDEAAEAAEAAGAMSMSLASLAWSLRSFYEASRYVLFDVLLAKALEHCADAR